MRVLLAGGARPNFVKVAPVLRALEARGAEVVLVHTGQHYDDAMSGSFFRELDVRDPDIRLTTGSGSHAQQTAAVLTGFEEAIVASRPDAVVVVGDVNATLAGTLAAAKLGVPVAHVEAGLRSGDRSMPEEVNRLCVDVLSDWLLTPSADADANLAGEGIAADRIFRVGNVMIDSLLHARHRADRHALHESLGTKPDGYALVTLHRPSNVDDPAVLARLLGALEVIARDRMVVFPAHPRAAERLREGVDAVRVVDPLGYLDFIGAMDDAAVVLTDSGGIQEETSVLGVPCLTLRETTERPITVTEGTNQVVGTDPDRILAAYREVPADRRPATIEGWDGQAAERVAHVLMTVAPPLAASRSEQA